MDDDDDGRGFEVRFLHPVLDGWIGWMGCVWYI